MSAEEDRKKEYAFSNFNTCDYAGSIIRIEVNKLENTQGHLGFCRHEGRWIDINPTCRICLRHRKKKKKIYKKTPTQRQRISQGRKRQRGKRLEYSRYRPYDPLV